MNKNTLVLILINYCSNNNILLSVYDALIPYLLKYWWILHNYIIIQNFLSNEYITLVAPFRITQVIPKLTAYFYQDHIIGHKSVYDVPTCKTSCFPVGVEIWST